ncbi:MAG: DNA/RNA non-specific endonuclease [Streptococcus sp.]
MMKEKRNSRIRLFALLVLVFTLGFGFSFDTSKQSSAVSSQVVQADENNGILTFNGQKQFVMEEKDQLGRAHSAHIQLQDKDEPKNKRPGKIKYDPVGWHNYKFYYGDGKSKSWLMNRGHLIGYQFSGVNDEGKNLVPMTAWLNSGNYKGTDEGNQSGMLYYENRLDNWLALHPNYWLDYKVTAIYSGDELLPRQVELQYVGIDSSGNLLEIKLGGDKETLDSQGVTHVVLDNQSPNAEINYADGTATNTVTEFTEAPSEPSSESSQVTEQPSSEPEHVQPAQEESRTVYVARHGTADVYWYDINSMPSNTNKANVVTMTEADALAQGKRHTSKE